MLESITISTADILEHVKLSQQVPELVEEIVKRKVILAAVAAAGIKVEVEELQKAADFFRITNKLTSAENTYKWLGKHGLSIDDFEKIVYTNMVAGELAQQLFANQIEPYFWKNQLDYAGVVMYEVILKDEDLAIELFYAIKEGEMSFYDVAHQYIEDIELRRKGGYLGVKRRQDLKPEVSAAVFAANPPEMIKPIVTSKGINLIFIEEIIQPQLSDELRQEILTNLFSSWINNKIDQIEIKVNLK